MLECRSDISKSWNVYTKYSTNNKTDSDSMMNLLHLFKIIYLFGKCTRFIILRLR